MARFMTLEEWMADHNSVIITTYDECPIGFCIHEMQEISMVKGGQLEVAEVTVVKIQFIIVRVATEAEYIAQMKIVAPHSTKYETRGYFYEAKRLVN